MKNQFIEIRCPNTRDHTIKDVDYATCGQLLGGIFTHGIQSAVYRCPTCKSFWEVTYEQETDELQMDKMDTKEKIKFNKHWRTVNG